jgi:hypothetical protein
MNSRPEELAFRKKLLVARSSLCRLHIRHETRVLRESLTWPRAARAAVSTPTGRGVVFLLAAEALGTERVARWLTVARRALVGAKLAAAVVAILRHPPASADKGPDEPA